MKATMTSEEMQPLFYNKLYRYRLTPNAGTELVPLAVPNYTYCRGNAPVYQWNGHTWVILRGELEEASNGKE